MPELNPGPQDLIGLGKAAEKGIDAVSDFLKTLLGPLVSEVGLAIADPVKDYRARRQARVLADAEAQLKARNATPQRVPLKLVAGILNAASVEEDGTLHDAWVSMLANAADKRTANLVHPSFAGILQQLSPQEVFMLNDLYRRTVVALEQHGRMMATENGPQFEHPSTMTSDVAKQFNIAVPSAELLVRNLYRLQLCEAFPPRTFVSLSGQTKQFCLSDFGMDFVRACTPPEPDLFELANL